MGGAELGMEGVQETFLGTLAEAVARCGWLVHAYVLIKTDQALRRAKKGHSCIRIRAQEGSGGLLSPNSGWFAHKRVSRSQGLSSTDGAL